VSVHRGPARRGRFGRVGWMAGAAGGVLVVAVAVAVAAQATGQQECAATAPVAVAPVAAVLPRAGIPTGTGFRAGVATFYGKDSATGGACSFVEKAPGGYTTALGPTEYAAGAACGMTLEVKGRLGTVRVKVTNLCPECPVGHLDLTNEAFAKVDDLARGKVAISYRVVSDPPLPGPLTVRVKEGSSQWWIGLLVDRHGNALRSVEISSAGHPWAALTRTDYNYWLASSGAGPGPFAVRVTDVRGHRVSLRQVALRPGVVQRSTVLMYPSPGAAVAAPPSTPSGGTAAAVRTTPASRSAVRSPAASSAGPAVSSSTGRPGTSTPAPGRPAAGAAPAPTAPPGCP
jgi:expansin